MSRTYSIADLHGRYDLLDEALAHIEALSEGGKVVFTGDYVDRGPDSRRIVERLMAGPPAGWEWVCLKGNHEDMMFDHCSTKRGLDIWMMNGGGSTLISYGHPNAGAIDVSVVPKPHLDWIAGLPLYYEDAHRVFVHAGVHPTLPLEEQLEPTMLWMLYPDYDPGGWRGKFVVHGHHQFEDGPKQYIGRIDMDTFAWATGRLVVAVFDDDKPGAPDRLIEIIGPPDSRYRDDAA